MRQSEARRSLARSSTVWSSKARHGFYLVSTVLAICKRTFQDIIGRMCLRVRSEVGDDQAFILDWIECNPHQLCAFKQQVLISRAGYAVGASKREFIIRQRVVHPVGILRIIVKPQPPTDCYRAPAIDHAGWVL